MKIKSSHPIIALFTSIVAIAVVAFLGLIPAYVLYAILVEVGTLSSGIRSYVIVWIVTSFIISFISFDSDRNKTK